MKKLLLLLSFSYQLSFSQGIWEVLNVPGTGQYGRYDDIYFLNDSVGWAVGAVQGNYGYVYHTSDSGNTWTLRDTFNKRYLRCIGFISDSVGFLGTLDSVSFLKTTNGGSIWHSVVDTFSVKPKSICGISIADAQTIYACGAYSGSPCVIKSTNGGNNWSYINMSSYASALVDVRFINAQQGFVTGTATPATDGGVVLYTNNGGQTWAEVFKSKAGVKEYVWKIQELDSLHWYCSLESTAPSAPTKIIYSKNGGFAWDTSIVCGFNTSIQSVGFLDTLHGFAGGYYPALFETKNGGQTWDSLPLGNSYNRFWNVNGKRAFLTGRSLYRYTDTTSIPVDTTIIDTTTSIKHTPGSSAFDDRIAIFPNPGSEKITIELTLMVNSFAFVTVINNLGQVEKELWAERLNSGVTRFEINARDLSPGKHYLQLHTNLGISTRPFVVVR